MHKSIKLFLFLTLLFTIYDSRFTRSIVQAAVIAPDAHLWIRSSSGTSLMTSPYAKNPNAPFMPVGEAYFYIYDGSSGTAFMNYVPYYTRNMHMNCVRFCFQPGWMKNDCTQRDTGFLDGPYGARAFVALCKQASVYLYLDAHDSMGDTNIKWTDDPKYKADWISDWQLAAAAFKDEPWVIGYELCNETCKVRTDDAFVRGCYMDCAAAVRGKDPNHVIFFGCGACNNPAYCDTLWASGIIPDTNTAVMAHYYTSYSYSSPDIENQLVAFSAKWKIPFLICEFGYNSSGFLGKDESSYGANGILALMRARKGGYFQWSAHTNTSMPNLANTGRMDLWQGNIAEDASPIPEPVATIKFMKSDFSAPISAFAPGTPIGVEFDAPDISPSTIDTLQIELHGEKGAGYLNDAETLTLTETGAHTGIFRNTIPTASGAVAISSNNTVEVRADNAETIMASYGPYISTTVKSNLTPLPAVSIQLEVTCKGIGWPNKMQADGSTPGKVRVTLRDASGEVARYATGPVTFSISPAYAYIVGKNPVIPVNGVAETAICSAVSGGGNCTLTASGNGASASAVINVVDYWHDMRVQKQDASWSNANGDVVVTDSATPKCVAVMENISGLQLEGEGYEYSTDGGLNWSGITEDFTSAALDPNKWKAHDDASKVTGSNGIRLNTSAANKHGELEYVPGIPAGLNNWRLKTVFGVKNLTVGSYSPADANTEFNINFYTQDNYSSYIPQTGYQLSIQYVADQNYCYPNLYQVVGGNRVCISSTYPYYCMPLYKFTTQWKMTVSLACHNGILEMWLDDENAVKDGGYLKTNIGSSTTFRGFGFSGRTGTANMPENWVYGTKLYNYLPSVFPFSTAIPYLGYISPLTKTTDNIPFTAGPVGTNQVRFIHYSLDDMLLGNERMHTYVVNLNGTNDATAPSNPGTVRDGLNQDISETNTSTQLSANWDGAADAESGIARYWFAVSATPGNADIVPWTSNGTLKYLTTRGLSLNVGTTYYISVKAENGAGIMGQVSTSNGQFPTVDLTPPVMTNISVSAAPTSAIIKWITDEGATSKVVYGPTSAYGSASAEDENHVINHSVTISNLQPNMVYHYMIISKDAANNESDSSDSTFSTNGAAIKAYPNPHDFTTGVPMVFAGTDDSGIEVKIFTVSGKLVRKLSAPKGASSVNWNGKNDAGQKVVPGLYLAKVTSGSGEAKTCKIALVK